MAINFVLIIKKQILKINLPKFNSPARLATKVTSSVEKIIRSGHPWVFEKGIEKIKPGGETGDLCVIFDRKKNKFLAVGLFDPASPIRIKILQAGKPVNINADFFSEKIQSAFAKRQNLLNTDTNAYRLIHGENDGMPGLIADVYDSYLVVKLYSGIWLPFLEVLLPELMEISRCQTLILRLNRNLQKNPKQLLGLTDGQILIGKLDNENIIFREHGLKFEANLIHGHKTGYFLDHRLNRLKVRELSKNKRVLDVFAYAGGFSINALAGGAKEVVSLDISAPALGLAKRNAEINDLAANHSIMVADAFEGLEKLFREGKKFDLVIVDPPSFAKKESDVPRAIGAYRRLTRLAVQLVDRSGMLLSASCSSRVKSDDFFETVLTEVRNSKRKFRETERTFHDDDHPIGFPEGAYLKSIYLILD